MLKKEGEKMLYCKNCDGLLDDGVTVCHYCGANPKGKKSQARPVGTVGPGRPVAGPNRPGPNPPKKNSGCGVVILILIILAALVGLIMFFSAERFTESIEWDDIQMIYEWEEWEMVTEESTILMGIEQYDRQATLQELIDDSVALFHRNVYFTATVVEISYGDRLATDDSGAMADLSFGTRPTGELQVGDIAVFRGMAGGTYEWDGQTYAVVFVRDWEMAE
jgi:hypothetical protein